MKPAAIIPPLSIVRLVRSTTRAPQWRHQIGRTFRIGYYSRQDGPDCVWLVNDAGQYEQTVDQQAIHEHFEIVELSKERALYGTNRPPIPPLVHARPQSRNGTLKTNSKVRTHALA